MEGLAIIGVLMLILYAFDAFVADFRIAKFGAWVGKKLLTCLNFFIENFGDILLAMVFSVFFNTLFFLLGILYVRSIEKSQHFLPFDKNYFLLGTTVLLVGLFIKGCFVIYRHLCQGKKYDHFAYITVPTILIVGSSIAQLLEVSALVLFIAYVLLSIAGTPIVYWWNREAEKRQKAERLASN